MNKVKDCLKYLTTTYFLLFFVAATSGQELNYSIRILGADNEIKKELEGTTDSLGFARLINKERAKLLKKGYLLSFPAIATLDTTQHVASIVTGARFKWGNFDVNEVPESLLSKAGFRKNEFKDAPVNAARLGELLSGIIISSETNGYPFAEVKLDSVGVNGDTISAKIRYRPGPEISYDSLVLLPNNIVKSDYMASTLGVRKGDAFNSKVVEKIPARIKGIAYCALEEPPTIKFENKSCKIKLPLKPVKANSIDALLGLAPNQNNKLLFTGYVNLDLQNLFKSGKQLYFSWRQLGESSQKLSTFYNHTNLFGSVVNIKGAFDLLKQDTTFINRNFYLNVGYDQASYSLELTSRYLVSRLLSEGNDNTSAVPEIDFDAQYYGIGFTKNEFDNKANPLRGWYLESGISVGAKKIYKTDFVPVEVYDSLDQQMLQGLINITGEGVVPLSRMFVLFGHAEVASINSKGTLFTNDLYRLGGVNSIRGFNELGIYASSYLLTKFETRLILGATSRLFAFVDWALVDNKVLKEMGEHYFGMGTGILLETKGGALQLVFAVGKSAQQSLSLTESKIHVGYVAKF